MTNIMAATENSPLKPKSSSRTRKVLMALGLLALAAFATVVTQSTQVQLTTSSTPAGIVSGSAYHDVGSTVSVAPPPATSNGYRFAYWKLNGVRKTDALGISINAFSFQILENSQAIAQYELESTDSDADLLPDWYEFQQYGDLYQTSDSDSDGDGVSLLTEYEKGSQPRIPDSAADGGIVEGGVSRRRGEKLAVIVGADYAHYTESSTPPGVVSRKEYLMKGTLVSTANLNGEYLGHRFTQWKINGVRQETESGIAKNQVSFTLAEDTQAVAEYIPTGQDSDADGLPDWYEMNQYGTIEYGADSDTDEDGRNFLDEWTSGTQPRIADAASSGAIVEGGISRRRAEKLSLALDVNYVRYQESSVPAGVVARDDYMTIGTSITTANPPLEVNGYKFSQWLINGVRQENDAGIAKSSVTFSLQDETQAVAFYYPASQDADADLIPDWYEIQQYGDTLQGADSDTDDDGVDFLTEYQGGTQPRVADSAANGGIVDGGISRRRAEKMVLNLQDVTEKQMVQLTLLSSTNGIINGSGQYEIGSSATLIATPTLGYIFSGWTGDASGTDNPLSLTMNADKTVGANFGPDPADTDVDGLTNYEEIVVHGTNPDVADTDGDGYNDKVESDAGTDPNNASAFPAPPSITSTNSYNGTVGVTFSKTVTATGSTPITFGASNLPSGLSISTSGVITGTPTTVGTHTATLMASNAYGQSAQSVTFEIRASMVYGLNYLRLRAIQAGSDADIDDLVIKDTDRNIVVYSNDFASANLDDFRTWFEADTPSLSWNIQEGNINYVREVNGRLRMESIGYCGGDGLDTYESWAGASLKQKLPENFELSFIFNRLGGWCGHFLVEIFTDPLFTESALSAGFSGHWFGGFTSFFPTPINSLDSTIYNTAYYTSDTAVKIVKSGAEAKMYINNALVATTQLGLVLDTDGDGLTDNFEEGQVRYSRIERNRKYTWSEAKTDAAGGGPYRHLATLTNESEKNEVIPLFSSQSDLLWLGAKDEAGWRWLTDELWSYYPVGSILSQGTASNRLLMQGSGVWKGESDAQTNAYLLEVGFRTSALDPDTDQDGISDLDEYLQGLNPVDAGNLDSDSDGDGLVDSIETNTGIWVSLSNIGTDPNKADTDGDGITDGNEAYQHLTNPNLADTDGDGVSDGIEIQNGSGPLDPASVPTFDLTFTTPQYGSLAGAGSFSWGTTATLTATPNAGYIFSGWTGDASGTDNPLSLTMSSDKTVGAAFGPDLADSDGDGYSNHDEIVIYKSNPNNAASIPGDLDGDGFFVATLLEGTGLMDAVGGDTMIVNAAGTPLASGIAAGGYFALSEAQVAAAVASEDYAQLLMAFVPFVSDDFVTGLRDYYIGDAIPGFHYFYQHLGTQPATLLGRPIYTFFGNGATLASSTELALVKHSASVTADNLSQSVLLFFDPYDDHTLVLGAAGTGTYSSDAIGVFDVPVATIALHFVGAILPPEIAVEQPAGTNIANNGSKDFGNVGLGLNNSLTFTISNSGDFPLSLSGTPRVAISGANAADFTVTADPDATVAAAGSTTFTVRFAPSTVVGARSAQLSIANNDSDENPFVINLSGTAAAVGSDLYWDTVSDDGAAITSGSGMWNTAAGNMSWSNGSLNMAWTQTSTTDGSKAAVFAGTDGTADQYVITLAAQIAAESITFNSSGYNITGSTLALMPTTTTNGAITVADGKTATIKSILRYPHNKGGADVTVGSNSTLNLGGGTTAAFNPQFNFRGAGTINLIGGTFTSNIGNYGNAVINLTSGTHAITPGVNVGAVISSGTQNVAYNLNGGTLTVNGNSTAHNNSFLGIGNGTSTAFTSTLNVSSGTMNVGTDASTAGEIRISGTAASNGTLNVAGGTVTVGTGKTDNKIYFFKSGADAGYTANMTQSAGTVTANGIQFGSAIGTYNDSSAANLTLSGGALYVGLQGITRGSGASTLPVTIRLEGGTIGASNDWSSSLDMKLGATGGGPTFQAATSDGTAKNITLSGVLSDDDSINGNLTKTGAGMLTLSGANTYTGATVINAGTLALGTSDVLPNLSAVSIGSATLDAATFADTAGTLDPTGSATINLGSGATLAFADSSSVDWTGGTLNINGTFVSGSSLRFGTTSGGLTPTQLNSITSSGFSAFSLNENGYLVGEVTPLTLSISTPTNGVITGAGEYEPGTTATLTATPNPGYIFSGWTGDATGTDNPLSLTMNADKTVGANFEQDLEDADGDGLSNYDEIIVYKTSPLNPDSDGDYSGDGFEVRSLSNPNVASESQTYRLKIKSVTKPSSFGNISNAKEIQLEGDTLAAWESYGNGNIHLFNFSEGILTYKSSIASPDTSHDWPAFGAQMSLLGGRLVTGDPITWISGIHDGRGYQYNIQDLQNPQFEHRLDRDAQTATYIGGDVLAVNGFSVFSSSGWSNYGTQNKVHVFRENGEFYQTWTDGYDKSIELAREAYGNSFLVARTDWTPSDSPSLTYIDFYNVVNNEIIQSVLPRLHFSFTYSDISPLNESGNQHSNNRFAFDGNKVYVVDDDYLRIFSLSEGAWNEASIDLRKYSGGSKFSSTNLLLGNDFLIVSSPNADCRNLSKGCVVIFDLDSANRTLRYRETITNRNSAISGEFGSYVALDEKTGHLLVSTEFGSSHAWGVVNSNNGNWIIYEGLKERNSSFQIIEGPFTWREAKGDAEARGGRLAVLNTQEKIEQANTFLQSKGSWPFMWIGLSDDQNEGQWKWIGGQSLAFSNWQPNQPSGSGPNGGDEDYGNILPFPGENSGMWNDLPNEGGYNSPIGYLLELPELSVDIATPSNGSITGVGNYALGSAATLTATPNPGYIFSGWTGDASGTDNPLSLTMNADKIVGANFEQDLGDADGDGLSNYAEVVTHLTNPNLADTDGDSYNDSYELSNSSNPLNASSLPTYQLALSDGGVVTGGSFAFTGNLAHGTYATLTATPADGYLFSGWTGDASGTEKTLQLLMDADKTVGATFVPDSRDFDGDGLTNYQEIVEHNTNPNMADTNSDGLRDGLAAALGMNPNENHSLFVETILAERAQLGLRKESDITDMRPGSMLLQRAPGSNKLQIRMKMQKSSNMLNWQDDGEAVIEVPVDPTSPKQFYRFGVK